MKYTYLIMLLMLFGMGSLVAQTTVSIENKVTAPAASVPVQVSMLNFSSVGAVTLFITYDSEVLSFQGIDNITAGPAGSWFTSTTTNTIIVQFTTPVNNTGYTMNGHIFDLKFGYLGGFNSNLTISSVEVANAFLTNIPVAVTNNGSVTQSAALATVNLGSDQPAASANPVTVPLNMATAQEFSSFIYKISFDPAKLSFVQILNQGVNGSITAPAPVNGVLTLTWNGTSYPSGYTGKVCDLKFVYNGGGDAPLTFKPGSQIVKSNTQVLATNYTNGKVVLGSFTSTLSLPTLTTDINATVTAPVNFVFGDEGSADIGAFNLKIGYDNTKLAYQGFTYGTIPSGVTISAVGGVLTVVWSNSANVTSFGGTLLNLKFKNIGTGTSALTFNAGTTVTQTNLSNVAVTTTNGSVVSNWLVTPATKTVIVGDPAFTFSVTTAGLEVFKWQYKYHGTGSWADLSNDATYSGVTSNILTVTGASLAMSTNTYQCVNLTTGITTTNFAVLTVNPAIAITLDPQNASIFEGGNTSFSVTATGSPLAYSWEASSNSGGTWATLASLDPTNIFHNGDATATLNVINAQLSANGSWIRCVVSSIPSNHAVLTVTAVTQPVSTTVNLGVSATFGVTAVNATAWKWQYSTNGSAPWNDCSGGVYSNETTATLSISGATASMNGYYYRCQLSPSTAPVTYTNGLAKLTVNPLVVNTKVILQGAYNGTDMNIILKTLNRIPLAQPYGSVPYNTAAFTYTGTESVGSIPADVVDWVLVELRTGTASATVTANGKKAGFLLKDGSIVGTDGSSLLAFPLVEMGNYYIVVRHRNHLPIMSAAAQPLSSTSVLYDFTTASAKAYGTGPMAALAGGKFGLWGGDVNLNNVIRYGGPSNDPAAISAAIGTSVVNAYSQYDVNMNGVARYGGPSNDPAAISSFVGTSVKNSQVP